LDDFYLRHADQVALASAHPDNNLVQHRGQPSTHDLDLLESVLSSLREGRLTKLPAYDKSLHNGAGDRTDTTTWEEVNRPQDPPVDVVIFEGWCVGFRSISEADLVMKWNEAVEAIAGDAHGRATEEMKRSQVARTKKDHLMFVNEALKKYEKYWE
jgi:D-glycerate 3-kinase